MQVAIYQQPGQPVSVVSFAPGIDQVAEAKRVVPAGIPFWIVDAGYLEATYSEQTPRNEWDLAQDVLNNEPSGIGEQ